MSIDKKWQYRETSFWSRELALAFADITVVGAGIVGLSAAINLRELAPSLSVKVVEAGCGTSGASTRNAGFACIGSISEMCSDIQSMGLAAAMEVVGQRYTGLQLLRQRVGDELMDYEPCGGYEVFQDDSTYDRYTGKVEEVNTALAPIVGPTCFVPREHSTLGKTIFNKVEGSLNPAKMMTELQRMAIEKGVQLVYSTSVTHIDTERQVVHTDIGTIHTKRIIVCSNAWAGRLLPEVEVRPARNQVLVSKPIKDMPIRGTYHMDKGYVYFRNIGDRLLIGGGRHLNPEGETTFDTKPTDARILTFLKTLVDERILPGVPIEIEQSWTGHLGVGEKKAPIVRKVADGLWAAVRMGGMGVAIGSVVGKNIAQMVADDWQHQQV